MVNIHTLTTEQVPKTSDEEVAGRLQFCVSMLGGITATKIADDIGVSVSAVTKWLRTGRITRPHLVDFAYRYEISIEWLMTGLGAMKSSASSHESTDLVPVYPLESWVVSGKTPLCIDEDSCVDRVSVDGDHLVHFGTAVHAPEIDRRVCNGKYFIFRATDAPPCPGDLVAITRKRGKPDLILRVVSEPADGVIEYASATKCLPTFSADQAEVVGVCVRVIDVRPQFF